MGQIDGSGFSPTFPSGAESEAVALSTPKQPPGGETAGVNLARISRGRRDCGARRPRGTRLGNAERRRAACRGPLSRTAEEGRLRSLARFSPSGWASSSGCRDCRTDGRRSPFIALLPPAGPPGLRGQSSAGEAFGRRRPRTGGSVPPSPLCHVCPAVASAKVGKFARWPRTGARPWPGPGPGVVSVGPGSVPLSPLGWMGHLEPNMETQGNVTSMMWKKCRPPGSPSPACLSGAGRPRVVSCCSWGTC